MGGKRAFRLWAVIHVCFELSSVCLEHGVLCRCNGGQGLGAGKGSGFLSRADGRKQGTRLQEDRPLYLPLVVSSQPAKQQPQTALVGGALPCQLLPLPSPSGCVAVCDPYSILGYSAHATQSAVVWGAFRRSFRVTFG